MLTPPLESGAFSRTGADPFTLSISSGLADTRSELIRSGGRHECLIVESESDVDREVGEQVGHLGSVAKLGSRLCARARMDAVALVGFHSSGANAQNVLCGLGVQVGVRRVIFRELNERSEHLLLVNRASHRSVRDNKS
jgi:hypothetical protein